MQIFTKILILAGTVFTGGYLLKLNRSAANLETVITAKLHSLKLSGLIIRVDALIKNPSKASIKIKFPFIKILYQGSVIGTTDVINEDKTIAGYEQTMIDGIMIHIPIIGLFSVALDLFRNLAKSGGVKIKVQVISTIYTALGNFPYTYEVEQTLKK
jgi:hypothetical protein